MKLYAHVLCSLLVGIILSVSIFAQDAKNTITAVSETGALGQRIRLDLRYDSQETDISRRPVAIGFSVKLDPNLFTIEQVILPNSPFYYYQPNLVNQSHGVVGITWVLSSQTSGASLPSNYTVATLVVRVSPSALTPVQTTRQGLIEITGSPVVIDASDASARQQTLKPINGAVTIIRAWPTPDQYVVRVPLPKDPPAPKAPLPTLISEGGYYPNDAMRGNVSLRNAQSGTGTVYSAAGNLFLPQVPDSLVELSQYPAGYTAFTVGPVPIDAWTLPATGLLFDGTKHVVAESYYDVQSAGTFGVSFDGVVTGARMRVLAQFTGGTAKVVAELVILSSGVVQFSSFTSEFDFYLGGGDPLVTKGVPLLPGQQIATTTQPFGNRTLTITWVNKRPDVKVAVGYRVFPVPDPTDPNITTGTTTFVVGHTIVKRDSASPFPIVFNAKSLSGVAGTPSLKLIP